jgi:hypothetical protein
MEKLTPRCPECHTPMRYSVCVRCLRERQEPESDNGYIAHNLRGIVAVMAVERGER